MLHGSSGRFFVPETGTASSFRTTWREIRPRYGTAPCRPHAPTSAASRPAASAAHLGYITAVSRPLLVLYHGRISSASRARLHPLRHPPERLVPPVQEAGVACPKEESDLSSERLGKCLGAGGDQTDGSRPPLGCLSAASRLPLGCLSAASRLPLGCLSAFSWLYLGCISVVSHRRAGSGSGCRSAPSRRPCRC